LGSITLRNKIQCADPYITPKHSGASGGLSIRSPAGSAEIGLGLRTQKETNTQGETLPAGLFPV